MDARASSLKAVREGELSEGRHNCGNKQSFIAPCSTTNQLNTPASEIHRCKEPVHPCFALCAAPGGRCFEVGNEDEKAHCYKGLDQKYFSHSGPHFCGSGHWCNRRCPGCNKRCIKSLKKVANGVEVKFEEHEGLCKAVHCEALNLKVEDYQGGNTSSTSGLWCSHVCTELGRGHVHLVPCQSNSDCCKGADRHRRSQDMDKSESHRPDGMIRKRQAVEHELDHEQFWRDYAKFNDPTEKKAHVPYFGLCPAYCGSVSEIIAKQSVSSKHHCNERLWHTPLKEVPPRLKDGHISGKGHYFRCNHGRFIILIIDRSGTMGSKDGGPLTRLKQVRDACKDFLSHICRTDKSHFVSVISFNREACIGVPFQGISSGISSVTTYLSDLSAEDSTRFVPALTEAANVIQQTQGSWANILSENDEMNSRERLEPAVFFLSDGIAHDKKRDILENIRKLHSNHQAAISTCYFGLTSNEEAERAIELLREMAKNGGGNFYAAPSGQDLLQSLKDFGEKSLARIVCGYDPR